MSRACLTTLVSIALCACAAAPAQARTAPGFAGLVNDELLDAPPARRAADLRLQASAGAGTLRQVFDWSRIERTPGEYDLGAYDALVADAAARRIRVLPVLFNAPSFRSSRPARGARRGVYPPSSPAEMGAFAAALVRRYGPGGTLWSRRPALPRMAIRSWQVWNEPNLRVYWASGVSPRGYVRLLAAVGAAVEKADPGAEIVSAGIPQSRAGMSFGSFVRGMYRAGARGHFDALAVHPYARGAAGTIAAVISARKLMNRSGDRRGRIWVTEVGWASGGPRSAFRTGSAGQARRVRGTLLGLARRRGRLRLSGVVYYKLRDSHPPAGTPDFFGFHTGLLERSGARKPAFGTFRRIARALRR